MLVIIIPNLEKYYYIKSVKSFQKCFLIRLPIHAKTIIVENLENKALKNLMWVFCFEQNREGGRIPWRSASIFFSKSWSSLNCFRNGRSNRRIYKEYSNLSSSLYSKCTSNWSCNTSSHQQSGLDSRKVHKIMTCQKKKTTYFETLSQTHACFTITVSTAQWTSLSKWFLCRLRIPV